MPSHRRRLLRVGPPRHRHLYLEKFTGMMIPPASILKNCRRAMADSGRLLVIESLLPASNEVWFASLLDLNLVMSGGQERTEAEFGRLFNASGLCLTRMAATAQVSIIEGIPSITWKSNKLTWIASEYFGAIEGMDD